MDNPYAPENESQVQSLTDLFGSYRIAEKFKSNGKRAVSERAMLVGYFCKELNKTRVVDGYDPLKPDRMGHILEKIPTLDLYALKSKCEDAARRGYSYSKTFWFEIRPSKT